MPGTILHCHGGADVRMRIVVLQSEIIMLKIEDGGNVGIDVHCRQRPRLAAELEQRLPHVILVQVSVTERVDEFTRFEAGDLSDH